MYIFLELVINWAKSLMPSASTTTAPVTPSAEPDDPPVKNMKCASVKSHYLVKRGSGTTLVRQLNMNVFSCRSDLQAAQA